MSPDANAFCMSVSDDQNMRATCFFDARNFFDFFELGVRLVVGVLEAEVVAGDDELVEVVEPRDLAL